MSIKYNVIKLKDSSTEEVKDFVSIEEPIEMSFKYKINNEWVTENLSITMRTPGMMKNLFQVFYLMKEL